MDLPQIHSAISDAEQKLAVQATPTGATASQLSQQGWRLWRSQEWDEAAVKFQQAVHLEPKNANAWNGLGWVQFNSGHSDAAEESFKKVIALQPDHPAALNGLGQIYLSERKYDDAEKFLLQAAPQSSAAWYGLARIYLLEGKFDAAEPWAQKMVDSGQADETGKKMLEAAQARKLSDGLRTVIEPAPSGKPDTSISPPSKPSSPVQITASSIEYDTQNHTLTAKGNPVTIQYQKTADQTLAEQPPVVVETFPVSGAQNVPAGETDIRVRFSKDMSDHSWSWLAAWENSTPESIGTPHYESDSRTCVARVKLESGHTYAYWINSDNFKNFKDGTGQPAVPYLLIFQTK
jgi:thioredoxin-like negative regulator of GroEL